MKWSLALLLLVPVLSGCMSGDSDGDGMNDSAMTIEDQVAALGTDWAQTALAGENTDPNHDHKNWTQHTEMTTPNFQKVGYNSLASEQFGGAVSGGFFCGGATTTEEGRRISVISGFDTSVAFSVLDVTDPTNPIKLGEYILENYQIYDIDMSPDGQHVVLAGNSGAQDDPESPEGGRDTTTLEGKPSFIQPKWRDACTGEVRLLGPVEDTFTGSGTLMVGIQDPENPVLEAIFPEGAVNVHSISSNEVDGVTYVISSVVNFAQGASYYHLFEVVDGVDGSTLEHLAIIDAAVGGDPKGAANGHLDAEIAKHPVTGQVIAYLSGWTAGVVVMDITIPQAPILVGNWSDSLPSGGVIHSTFSLPVLHNERHYVLAGQEFTAHPTNRPSGWIYVLDDTDPANVFEVARWTLPIEVQDDWYSGVELFSTHYFRVVDSTAFVAMYHGGVWAFPLEFDTYRTAPTLDTLGSDSGEGIVLPGSIGVFMPDQYPDAGRVPDGFYDYSPFVLDLFAYDDYSLVVYDGLSGAYTVQFDPDHPMASPEPWPREGVVY
jgi:hypothetical protein